MVNSFHSSFSILLKNSRGDMFSGTLLPPWADISRESSAGVFLRAGICLGQSRHISMSVG
ncbi:hypothetical protein [Bacteroides eggerthii]|uniref:hypothetical protein n=1 Tax=Bacteroides eggerthii TaxID=28111 RepID=UPI0018990849|nr:hypothetical protein [Bacteroides eggerthii]